MADDMQPQHHYYVIVVSINDPTDPLLDHISNSWPLEEYDYEEVLFRLI